MPLVTHSNGTHGTRAAALQEAEPDRAPALGHGGVGLLHPPKTGRFPPLVVAPYAPDRRVFVA